MQTLCYLKIFRLSKEYSAQIILDGKTNPIKGLCSTSITWPSIQSVKPVKEGFTFIISPNFGSMTICFKYLFCAKIHRSFQNTKYFQTNLQKGYCFL